MSTHHRSRKDLQRIIATKGLDEMIENKMKLVDGPINAGGWFDDENLNIAVTDKLRYIFQKEPPILSFRLEYDDPDDSIDPVTIHVDLPLGIYEGDTVSFACSLESAVNELISSHTNWHTGEINDDDDDKGREICSTIASRLRELADKLENAMEKK
jgi:hypothetical protein